MVTNKGRIVVAGARGDVKINPRLLMGPESQIRAIGCYGFTASWNLESKNEEMKNYLDCLYQMAAAQKLKPKLGEKFELSQAAEAHRRTIENEGCLGKKYFCFSS